MVEKHLCQHLPLSLEANERERTYTSSPANKQKPVLKTIGHLPSKTWCGGSRSKGLIVFKTELQGIANAESKVRE